MGKVFIIAVDGLEFVYVGRWLLRGFIQEKCGKYQSTTEKSTPHLWACIITGRDPEKSLKTNEWVVYKNPLINLARKYLKFLRGKGLGRFFEKKWVDKKYLASECIFDKYPSIVVNFPAYNWRMPKGMISVVDAVGNREKAEKLLEVVERMDQESYEKIVEMLEQNSEWKIGAVWFYSADIVNHVFWYDRARVFLVYHHLEWLAVRLRRLIEKQFPETTIIILSDHGGRRGMHTPYGFISVNKRDLDLPERITEIYGWLVSLIEQ